MYPTMSTMPLVLFAMVLIMSGVHGEGFLSQTKLNFECSNITSSAGSLLCKLYGSKGMSAYLPKSCQLRCYDPNQKLDLHQDLCPMGSPDCTEDLKKKPY